MSETKTMDAIHRGLLKKFHTLCSLRGMSAEDKREVVRSYGVESSRDIDTHDLVDLCARLSAEVDGVKRAELDKLRKRAMASIGGYLRAAGYASSAEMIKGIACRATGYGSFNKIPVERLRNLVYAFNNKVKDMQGADAAVKEVVLERARQESAPTISVENFITYHTSPMGEA